MAIGSIILYAVLAYIVWWGLSRAAMLSSWLYSKPGSLRVRHYVFIALSVIPFVMEIISTILIIFAIAFGINPTYPNKGPNIPDILDAGEI
jgi:hypothetical protein